MKSKWMLALAFGLAVAPAWAQKGGVVRLIVPFATGGPTDIAARVVAPYLGERTGRPWVVENKVGATGAIGTELVARAAPDGATILFGTSSSMGSSPAISPKLPYDVIRDFVPVGMVATTDNVLVVHTTVPAGTLREFIAYAKANPGKIAYGTSGVGSTYHLGSELFAAQTGTTLTHVPYKGAGPAAQDLVAGQIQMMMDAFNSALPNIKSGRVKALAIASPRRHPDLPDVPTLTEQGVKDADFFQWLAFFMPANAPKALADKLNADLAVVLGMPEVKERFSKLGMQAAPGSPQELATILRGDLTRWTRVVKDANIKPE
ncbi:MAG: tripartite tricarboxylate transporter substrate binding protein [Betaproteobacteria bacterium]|nr:tripartite tricarboxylate transporter substrate binding protein [Betaproteobacteria bacterium]